MLEEGEREGASPTMVQNRKVTGEQAGSMTNDSNLGGKEVSLSFVSQNMVGSGVMSHEVKRKPEPYSSMYKYSSKYLYA